MRRTHASLFYLAGYLLAGGIGLLVSPRLALSLLMSTGDYGTVFPRMCGMFLVGLGMIVVQIIRHDIQVLYPTTLAVRGFFLVCLAAFYVQTRDPFFLVLLGIVGLGVLLTGSSYVADRRRRA